MHMELETKLPNLYKNGSLTPYGMCYDNPNWLEKAKLCRTTMGVIVDPKIVNKEEVKLLTARLGLVQTSIPAIEAESITVNHGINKGRCANLRCVFAKWLLRTIYMKKYGEGLKNGQSEYVYMGAIFHKRKTQYFLPTPPHVREFNKHINPIAPRVNEEGAKYLYTSDRSNLAPRAPRIPSIPEERKSRD